MQNFADARMSRRYVTRFLAAVALIFLAQASYGQNATEKPPPYYITHDTSNFSLLKSEPVRFEVMDINPPTDFTLPRQVAVISRIDRVNQSSPYIFLRSATAVNLLNQLIGEGVIVVVNLRFSEMYSAVTLGPYDLDGKAVLSGIGSKNPAVVLVIRADTTVDEIYHESVHVRQHTSGKSEIWFNDLNAIIRKHSLEQNFVSPFQDSWSALKEILAYRQQYEFLKSGIFVALDGPAIFHKDRNNLVKEPQASYRRKKMDLLSNAGPIGLQLAQVSKQISNLQIERPAAAKDLCEYLKANVPETPQFSTRILFPGCY